MISGENIKVYLKELYFIKGHVKFLLFRPHTVIYIENDLFLTVIKIGQGLKSLPLMHREVCII